MLGSDMACDYPINGHINFSLAGWATCLIGNTYGSVKVSNET